MKKIMLLLSLVTLFVACEPRPEAGYEAKWYVKNGTDQALVLTFPHYDKIGADRKIAPGDSVILRILYQYSETKPLFGQWLQESVSIGKDVVEVLSEDDVILKKWSYEDREQSGKQLFKESSWQYYERVDLEIAVWTFEIQPEDIVQQP